MKNIYKYKDFLTEARKRKDDMSPEELERADAASKQATETRGFDEVRKDQVAVIYFIAKNNLKTIGLINVSKSEYPAYIDMKANTYTHTIKKVENIISDIAGIARKYPNEGDVPKYTNWVKKFQKMSEDDLQDLALQALEGGKQRAAKQGAVEDKTKAAKKMENGKLVNAISDYVRAGIPADKAIAKVAKDKGIENTELKAVWDKRVK